MYSQLLIWIDFFSDFWWRLSIFSKLSKEFKFIAFFIVIEWTFHWYWCSFSPENIQHLNVCQYDFNWMQINIGRLFDDCKKIILKNILWRNHIKSINTLYTLDTIYAFGKIFKQIFLCQTIVLKTMSVNCRGIVNIIGPE